MPEVRRFCITTAIDYPNSRPHIGTAFEKIGADVQARYRRMEGYAVFFLMGNDENTIKVAKRRLRIYEVGISYWGRTYEEGKKIGLKDAFRCLWCLFKYSIKERGVALPPAVHEQPAPVTRRNEPTSVRPGKLEGL